MECDKKPHYQLRYLCKIKKINELTPDPDNGEIWTRELVPLEDLNKKYLQWSVVGDKLVELAQQKLN